MNKKALGRGLESLIPKPENNSENYLQISPADIAPNPYQPRKNFDSDKIRELAESFRENGIIQPVIVRETKEGYQLIAGERRLQAAKLAGMGIIPALVRNISDIDMLKISLVENIQRDDLNPLEEAFSYNKLSEDFGMSREEIANALGKSRAGVTNTIRILKLPEYVKEEISAGAISRGHAIALLGLESPSAQTNLCKKIIAEGLSVRETERLVKKGLSGITPTRPKKEKSAEISEIESKLQMLFGTRVNINTFKKGGRVEIEYYSEEDLNRILEALNITC
jgi:ParB family transcriptional regulator, chromosome partitioning protein